MARQKSEFLKSFGTAFEIWKSLTDEVLARGGTDDDIRRIGTSLSLRAKLAQLVVGNKPTFELYLAPAQRDGGSIKGLDLEEHLKEAELIDRTYSLDDEMVKGWLADPSTYPEEFKGKAVFLWKSQQPPGVGRNVACLVWDVARVVVNWHLARLRVGRPPPRSSGKFLALYPWVTLLLYLAL